MNNLIDIHEIQPKPIQNIFHSQQRSPVEVASEQHIHCQNEEASITNMGRIEWPLEFLERFRGKKVKN